MPNPGNLRPKPFTTENQPKNRRSRKGIPNRATVLRKWLKVKIASESPLAEGQTVTAEDEITLALIAKARTGDVAAIKEVHDTLHGKITDKLEIDVDRLDADIERELALLTATGQRVTTDEAESETLN